MIERIGLTMRTTSEARYEEDRDALAHDWIRFFKNNFPRVQWIPVPNMGNDVISFTKNLGLQGLILTGGNDLGESPLRDSTENLLIAEAIKTDLPVLGVCRGMQMLNSFFGGKLIQDPQKNHVATQHEIEFIDSMSTSVFSGQRFIVNSYHGYLINNDMLGKHLKPLAVGSDGSIEAFRHQEKLIYGVQWHPERTKELTYLDQSLFAKVFNWSHR